MSDLVRALSGAVGSVLAEGGKKLFRWREAKKREAVLVISKEVARLELVVAEAEQKIEDEDYSDALDLLLDEVENWNGQPDWEDEKILDLHGKVVELVQHLTGEGDEEDTGADEDEGEEAG